MIGLLIRIGDSGVAPPVTPAVTTAGGASSKARGKYPRRVYVDGQLITVRSADEERDLLRALHDKARAVLAQAEQAESQPAIEAAHKRVVKIARRIEAVASREDIWLERLRAADEELLILLH